MDSKLYFAYGSNINLEQMAYRCPNATVVKPVTLDGYELLFRGNPGGYGVATIAPKEGSQVHGLLWNITPKCEQALDFYEGYPRLYGKETVSVRDNNGDTIPVMAYIMTGEIWRDATLPSPQYYAGIWGGYEANGLPTDALRSALRRAEKEVFGQDIQPPKPTKAKSKGAQSHER